MLHGSLDRVVEQGILEEAQRVTVAVKDFVHGLVSGRDPVEAEEMFRGRILAMGAGLAQRALEHEDYEFRSAIRRRGHRAPDGSWCGGTLKSKGVKETTILTLLGEMTCRRWTCICRKCGKWLGALEELLVLCNTLDFTTR